jgi:hypothetical protein
MSDGGIDDLVGQIPIGQLAAQLGVSEDEAERAVRAALPALLGGMQANAGDPAGAASLARALGDHDGSLLEGGADLGQVDSDDGARIVRNVFGDNEEAVVDRLGGLDGLSSGLMGKLLPMLAPLLLAFLSKKVLGSGASGGGGADAPSGSSPGSTSGMGPGAGGMGPGGSADAGSAGGGLGDILGGGGGGLGDILGGLLGGGGGGGLGDVLGGLLGGGKR